MSSNPDSVPDTYFRVLNENTKVDIAPETIRCTGETDMIKASNLDSVVIANKTFIGNPGENDIDLCRGSNAVIGPNDPSFRPGVSNITIKGGFDGVTLTGNLGTVELGQFSIYDKWFALPKTRGVVVLPGSRGKITCWHAERPTIIGPVTIDVEVKMIHPFIVWVYFVYRSIGRTIYEKFLQKK